MGIPRVARVAREAREARAAREAREAREARVRIVAVIPGIIDTPQWMGHGMACAYATVSKGLATENIVMTILIERHRILRRGRVMGSSRLSAPRGFHVSRRTRVTMELNASSNMVMGLRR